MQSFLTTRNRPMRPFGRRRCAVSGFSLVEFIVVISIMAIVGAMVVPMVAATEEFALPYAAQIMQRDFEYAQVEAQRLSDDVVIIVYPWNETYGMWDRLPTWRLYDHPFWSGGELAPNGMVDLPRAAGSDSINILSANLDNSNYYFQYNERGEPVNLWNEQQPIQGDCQVVLRQGSREYVVEVTPIVGTVRTFER